MLRAINKFCAGLDRVLLSVYAKTELVDLPHRGRANQPIDGQINQRRRVNSAMLLWLKVSCTVKFFSSLQTS